MREGYRAEYFEDESKKIEVPDALKDAGHAAENPVADPNVRMTEAGLHDYYRRIDSENPDKVPWEEPSEELLNHLKKHVVSLPAAHEQAQKTVLAERAEERRRGLVEVENRKNMHEYERSLLDEEKAAQGKKKAERASLYEHVKKNADARKAEAARAETRSEQPPEPVVEKNEKPKSKRKSRAKNPLTKPRTPEDSGEVQEEFPRSTAREQAHTDSAGETGADQKSQERQENKPYRLENQAGERSARDASGGDTDSDAAMTQAYESARGRKDTVSEGSSQDQTQGQAQDQTSAKETEARGRDTSATESAFVSARERFKRSELGLRLASSLNSMKLRAASESVGRFEEDLHVAETSLRLVAADRLEQKRRFDDLTARAKGEAKGLRGASKIPESAVLKSDKEQKELSQREIVIQNRIESLRTSLNDAHERREEFKVRGLDIIKRAHDRAEKLIAPEADDLAHMEGLQGRARTRLDRFEAMALKAEKRLNAAKLSVKDARFDSERTVLEGWMRKDELLVKRLRAGRAGKNGRVGLDGWKKRVASYDGAINLYRTRIDGHQNFLQSLKSQYESSFETQQSQRRSTEAPQQSRAERPETQSEPSSESRSEQRSERTSGAADEDAQTSSASEAQPSGRERESAKDTPSEQEAKRFAGEWNSRYGSQFKVNANELERLIPDDRVPNAYEMGSILETYLMMRPWGLWKVPGLKGLFSFVIKNRIRSLRDAM